MAAWYWISLSCGKPRPNTAVCHKWNNPLQTALKFFLSFIYLLPYFLSALFTISTGATASTVRRGYVFAPANLFFEQGQKRCIADGYREWE
jgi:hypothetical protein